MSVLHNIVHGLFGIAGLALAKTASGARTFLVGGGAIYVVLWLLGLVGGANWIPSNSADDWLHLGLGGGADRSRSRADARAERVADDRVAARTRMFDEGGEKSPPSLVSGL